MAMFSFNDDDMFAADGTIQDTIQEPQGLEHVDPNRSLPLEAAGVDSTKELDLFGATQPLDMDELDRRQTFFGADRLDFAGVVESSQTQSEPPQKRIQPIAPSGGEELVSAVKYRELREKFKTLHSSYQRVKAERTSLAAELENTRQALAQSQQQLQAANRYGSVSRRRSLSEVGHAQVNARGRTNSPVKLAQRRLAHKEAINGQASQDLETQYNAVVRQLAALQQWVRTVTHPPSTLMRPPGGPPAVGSTPRSQTRSHSTPRNNPPVPPFRPF